MNLKKKDFKIAISRDKDSIEIQYKGECFIRLLNGEIIMYRNNAGLIPSIDNIDSWLENIKLTLRGQSDGDRK